MPPTAVNIDDMDQSISYSGAWQEVEGSTRQWGGGTVHSTTQKGASASISFSGTRIRMYVTLYHGLGNEIANINFNGQTTTISTPSQPTDVYNNVWFDSGELPSGRYTFVVSNGGGSSDTPFQLDRFNIEGLVETPSASAPTPASPLAVASPSSSPTPAQPSTQAASQSRPISSNSVDDSSAVAGRLLVSSVSSTNGGSVSTFTMSGSPTTGAATALGQTTVVSIQSVQGITTASIDTGGSPTQVAQSAEPSSAQAHSRNTLTGPIIGGAIGGSLFLLVLVLFFLVLWRRKAAERHVRLPDEGVDDRRKSPTAVTPFRLDTRSASSHNLYSTPEPLSAESPASPLVAAGCSTRIIAHGYRRSIEKHAISSPMSSRGTMVTTTSASGPAFCNIPSNVASDLDQPSAGVGSLLAHQQPTGDGVSTFASSSFYMPAPDNTDTARPPPYHLL